MPFDLHLSFTGIAAFVQITEDTPVWVVMPGLDGPKDALDGEPLCPHNSYIELDGKMTSLKGQVVTFDLAYAGSPSHGSSYLPYELIDMQVLLGELCVIDRAIVAQTSPPRPAFVMTQVLLPPGEFSTVKEYGWSIDQVDASYGAQIKGTLAHVVTLTIKNLTSAKALLEAMDGTGTTCIDLTPPGASSDVNAQLVNTCKELGPSEERTWRDRDFKWYFELLEKEVKLAIVELIENEDLPIPRYTPEDNVYSARFRQNILVVTVGGHDCFPAQMAGYSSASISRTQRLRARAQNRRADRPSSTDRPFQGAPETAAPAKEPPTSDEMRGTPKPAARGASGRDGLSPGPSQTPASQG
jgi:hypothetical protein